MRTIKTQDCPGMITAEPVLSKHGQLIVAADTELYESDDRSSEL